MKPGIADLRFQIAGFRTLVVVGLLLASVLIGNSVARADWKSDERMVASIQFTERVMTLDEICSEMSRQTSSEFYVDRRNRDAKISWFAGQMQLRTAMSAVEAATNFRWRMVGDMFFLCRDVEGVAVGRWKDRYAEAKKAETAGTRKKFVRDWAWDSMPFPLSADAPWTLTPLQSEQLAYQQALLYFTMTPEQLDWLNIHLVQSGYMPEDERTPVALAASRSYDAPIKFNAAMVIHLSIGDCLVEMPLDAPKATDAEVNSQPKLTKIGNEPASIIDDDRPKKLILTQDIMGLWITDEEIKNLPQLMEKAADRGYNAIFLPVFKYGHTVYPGKKYPQERVYKGSDPLAAALTAAKKHGIAVHAVIDTTLWGDAERMVPTPANYPALFESSLLGRTYQAEADWQRAELMAIGASPPPESPIDDKRVYLCPAASQLPRLLTYVVEEIADNYDVAGICLDGTSYPTGPPFVVGGEDVSPPYGYTLEVRREMIRQNQIDPIDIDADSVRDASDAEASLMWERFRRGKLTGLVNSVCAAYKAKKADGITSVALDFAADGQSPVHWSRLQSLDAVLPRAEIRKTFGEALPYKFPREDADALKDLQLAVVKYAGVVPVVDGLKQSSLPDRVTAAVEVVKLGNNGILRGSILRGDVNTLSSALDMLPE